MAELYPPIEPYEHGMLDVGDRNLVYWETCGNPDGKPALVVHGGPGSGCTPGHRQYFDPDRYRVVLFDQRGCGRSTPNAGDPATDMRPNTTGHLLADMERLREHLGIGRWLLSGASWGSTLLLAYAERHPERVLEIVVNGVTVGRHGEYDWLYRGVGRSSRRSSNGSAPVRERAVRDWCAWEDAVVSLEPKGKPNAYSGRPPESLPAFVRIAAHYASHHAWLEDGVLLREAGRLAGIPGVLIHGRLDLGSPLENAWSLARAWPDAELVVVWDSGHTGNQAMAQRKRAALDRFAQ